VETHDHDVPIGKEEQREQGDRGKRCLQNRLVKLSYGRCIKMHCYSIEYQHDWQDVKIIAKRFKCLLECLTLDFCNFEVATVVINCPVDESDKVHL
jgi:hypothetical protein